MKISSIACAVLAGTMGFSSLAAAQGYGGRGEDRREARQQRHDDRREFRQERREHRREARQDQREWHRDQQRAYTYQQRPHMYHQQPTYTYRHHAPAYGARYHRGGYLPHEYRQSHYHVSNWQAYPRLYAPPYGHQWVQVGSDFALMALATGLIVNLLANG